MSSKKMAEDAQRAGKSICDFFNSPGGQITKAVARSIPFGYGLVSAIEQTGSALSGIPSSDEAASTESEENSVLDIFMEIERLMVSVRETLNSNTKDWLSLKQRLETLLECLEASLASLKARS